MKCEYCDLINRKSKQLLYEDKEVVVAVKDLVAIPGQITVFPKEHFTILEMVPQKILEKCALFANKVGMAVFESLGAEGTNIIIQNGLGAGQKVPHFSIEVIPRRDGDGLNLWWQPIQLAEDQLEIMFKLLKEEADKIVLRDEKPDIKIEKNKKEIMVKDKDTEMKLKKEDENNYLLKSLKRIP